MSAPRYAGKPDANRAAIVEAIRKVGASVVDLQGRPGTPDLAWGYRGRMGLAEVKVPGKANGVCGCDNSMPSLCSCLNKPTLCKGHLGTGNAERTTWHRQLAWHEAWKGTPVAIWTTAEEAIATVTDTRGGEVSYRCGLGPGLGNTPPTVFCDAHACVARREINGDPPRWFLARKPVPGWSLARTEHEDGRVTRIDLCPKHRASPHTRTAPPCSYPLCGCTSRLTCRVAPQACPLPACNRSMQCVAAGRCLASLGEPKR